MAVTSLDEFDQHSEITPGDKPASIEKIERLAFIDGLRALAALGVVFFHFVGHRLFEPPPDGTVGFLFGLARHGNEGVPVFFVISGFVIAHTIGTHRISRAYFATFLARRLVRLSPPYWATIIIVVITTYLGRLVFDDYKNEIPSVGSVLAHAAYVYPFLGYEPILAIFWTLVHTVQFYLFFTLLVAAMQKCWGSEQPCSGSALLLIVVPGVLSAIGVPVVRGLCVNTWYMFCLGLVAYWWHRRWISTWLSGFFVSCVVITLIGDPGSHKLTAILSTMAIMLASQFGRLGSWFGCRPLRFLGRISYSLFLIHGTVGWRVLSVGERLTGRERWFALGWLCLAVGSMKWPWLSRPRIAIS